ncbi:hypothetical protein [Pseudomonas sp. JR33AA]|uniref:hypothetical protein n=1 Tax=Pseudomonas sp. JR33AA TaxID=2899113 RepID=UPI001F1C13C7|nr:hypothetical protein [Pseudomonas sp. JR33AA]MCE5980114.1 hypothetical protein [Pseudomonas sp. JR33AA]
MLTCIQNSQAISHDRVASVCPLVRHLFDLRQIAACGWRGVESLVSLKQARAPGSGGLSTSAWPHSGKVCAYSAFNAQAIDSDLDIDASNADIAQGGQSRRVIYGC